jgi:hypothetical protein
MISWEGRFVRKLGDWLNFIAIPYHALSGFGGKERDATKAFHL